MTNSDLLNSFKYAFEGLGSAIKTQRNLRIHIAVGTVVVIVGIWFDLTRVEWAIISITIGIVVILELLNTSIEALVDLISPDFHPLAKMCKDIGAASVLIAAIVSIVIGALLLGPPLYELLRNLTSR